MSVAPDKVKEFILDNVSHQVKSSHKDSVVWDMITEWRRPTRHLKITSTPNSPQLKIGTWCAPTQTFSSA